MSLRIVSFMLALGVLAVFARAAREPTEAEIKLAHVTAHLAAIAIGRNDSKAAG